MYVCVESDTIEQLNWTDIYIYIYIYVCVYISPLFEFISHLGHHRILGRVPRAIPYVLIGVLFYT